MVGISLHPKIPEEFAFWVQALKMRFLIIFGWKLSSYL